MAFVAIFLLSNCSKENSSEIPNVENGAKSVYFKSGDNVCGQITTVNFIAGQNINVGTVEVANDADSIYVTYKTSGDWRMKTLHLFVGKCTQLPINKSGNPVPGQFPFTKSFGTYSATEYTFSLLKSTFDSCFCVAAHAEVAKSNGSGAETAWGQGTRFVQKGNWGMYFSACKQACINPCTPKQFEGCTYSPVSLFDVEGTRLETWGSANINIAGFSYSKAEILSIYEVAPNNNDAWNAFVAIAAIKISGNNVAADASVRCYLASVETWLATLGKLSPNNLPATAPQNIQPTLSALLQWVEQKQCP